MTKRIALSTLAVVLTAASAEGSAYRIPEQSVDSTATSGAHVAYTPGADAAYFNPANMSWRDDKGAVEVDLTYINLPGIEYTDRRSAAYNGESEVENFFLPTFFAVSPNYNNFRVGVSLTFPAGLAKQWQDAYPRTYAEEFRLTVAELNPTLSYKINDYVSLAGGVRALYSEAKVRSQGLISQSYGGVQASRVMEGDTNEYGYNLALSVRPNKDINLSATYRSTVDLDLEGDANLWTSASFAGPTSYNGTGAVTVPVPAVLALAASYTFDRFTVELEYDKTYWSDYEYLDFRYPTSLRNAFLIAAFDDPKAKHWSDTDTWRLGLTYRLNSALTLMAGIALDENPIPDETLGFDLPDSDALLLSCGVRYRLRDNMEVGIAYLYDSKEDRSVTNSMVNGEFSGASAHLLTMGFSYRF